MSKKKYITLTDKLTAVLYNGVCRRTRKKDYISKGFGFDLVMDDIKQLLIDQNLRCAVTHVPFNLFECSDRIDYRDLYLLGGNGLAAASVDRIDNNKGYIKGNVQIVTQFVNLGRTMKRMDELLEMIEWIKNPPTENPIFNNK